MLYVDNLSIASSDLDSAGSDAPVIDTDQCQLVERDNSTSRKIRSNVKGDTTVTPGAVDSLPNYRGVVMVIHLNDNASADNNSQTSNNLLVGFCDGQEPSQFIRIVDNVSF